MSKFLPLICMMATSGTAIANHLSPEQALARLEEPSVKRTIGISGRTNSPELELTLGNLYVFSVGDGFAVLPAYDEAPAVLAFADSGRFDYEGNPALAYWMEFYNAQLEQISDQGYVAKSVRREARAEIAPLLETEWNQEAPYNELCPKVNGHETVTGCVATAMAQAMKYFNYPAHGTGTHSYYWRPGEEELSFDYENTPFQWDLMTDRYDATSSEEARHAVAELMLGCGISVDMHYEPGGSGAATTAMGTSLIDIFKYSPALWMPNRAYYGYYEWENMIYDELAKGHPVLYSGAGTGGGHQFVCDGYRGGYFHFNWGWGGMSNGYFLMTALNPDDLGVGGGAGGFNTSQVATLGMRPAEDGDEPVYLFYNTIGFSTDVKTVKEGEPFRCGGQYFNYSLYTMPEGSRLGMKFKETDDSDGSYVEGPEVGGFHPDDGRYDLQVSFPDLPDGTYIVTPALKVNGKWYDVRMPVGLPASVTAVVSDKMATITDAASAEVEVTDISMPATVYRDRDFPLTFKAVNSGKLEYYGNVTPVMINAAGKEVAESKFRPLDILPDSNEDVSDYIAFFSAIKDEEFPAGTYRLVFKNDSGKYVSTPVEVNVEILSEETRITVTDFKLENENPVGDADNVTFIFRLNCQTGVYFSNVELLIFPGDGGVEVYKKNSGRIYLTSGESSDSKIVADLHDLKDGEYIALIYSAGKAMTDRIYFNIKRDMTGLYDVTSDASVQEYYDLTGRKCNGKPVPGIYISRGQKILVRP